MKKFENIWKEATAEADLKYDSRGILTWGLLLKEALKKRIEPLIEKQQPEIPEFVANHIEAAKEDFWTLLSAMDDPNISSRVGDWLKGGNFRNQEIFAQAWINGYTVAKESRFYLREKNTGFYLNKGKNAHLELVSNPYFDKNNVDDGRKLSQVFTVTEVDRDIWHNQITQFNADKDNLEIDLSIYDKQ